MTDLTKLTPDDLAGLSEEDMKAVVDADLRRTQTRGPRLPRAVSDALRSPAHIDRYHAALVSVQASLAGQLVTRADDFESDQARLRRDIMKTELDQEHDDQARRLKELRIQVEDRASEYLRHRARTMRFKSGVDEDVAACESMRTAMVTKLRNAIEKHRRTMLDEGIDASSIDEELWRSLD